MTVLFICTSHDMLGDTNDRTGIWLEELAAPYYLFKEVGAELVIVSAKGGAVPVDPRSESIMAATKNTKRFLNDHEAIDFLSHSSQVSEVQGKGFDVAFLTGGHGALWDIAENTNVKELLETFNNEYKLIAAVSQGVAGLLTLRGKEGELLVQGRKMTGTSNSEEESAGLTSVVPFLLETALISLDVQYSKGVEYISYVVVDGNIITGQNPASSEAVAKKIIACLKLNKPGSTVADVIDLANDSMSVYPQ